MDSSYLFRDRLIDILLEELIGGNIPPDLSKRILQRALAGEKPYYNEVHSSSVEVWILWRKKVLAMFAAMVIAVVSFFGIRYVVNKQDARTHFSEYITKKVGNVRVDNNRIDTSRNSFCRLDLNEGTIVAVGEKSTLQFTVDDNSRMMTLVKGTTYLDISKQPVPFVFRLGESQIKITGTKLFLSAGGRETESLVAVLQGKTVYSTKGSFVTLEKGEVATYKGNIITVMPLRFAYKNIEWLDKLDISSRKLFTSCKGRDSLSLPRQIDFANYDVYDGQWELSRDASNIIIRQTDPRRQGVIFLGRQKWIKGILNLKFKVNKVSGQEPAVHIGFLYDKAWESFGVKEQLSDLIKSGEWVGCRVPFEILSDNRFVINNMELWQESKNSQRRVSLNFEKNTQNTQSPSKRTACRIGLVTSGCSVDFKDIYLENAVPMVIKPIALYNFKEGKGIVVHDISGFGQPLDLNIQKSELVEWTNHGLLVKGTACIESHQITKLLEAWKENGALTFEFWLKSSPAKMPKTDYVVFSLLEGKKGYFCYWRTYDINEPSDDLNHIVVVLSRYGNIVRSELYCNGILGNIRDFENMVSVMDNLTSIQLSEFLPRNPETKGWIGEYRSFAIYNYAMSAEDVRRHYETGNDTNLIAWYRFDEGDGRYVRDYADTDENLDLTIKNQDCVQWQLSSIRILGSAQISSSPSGKISRTLAETGTVSVGIWSKSGNVATNQLYSLGKVAGQRGSSIMAFTHRKFPNNHLVFSTVILNRINDDLFVTTFVNNAQKIGERYFKAPIGRQFVEDSLWLKIPFTENTKGYENILPWKGKLYSIKIFGKKLSEKEIVEHYEREKYNIILKASEGKYTNTRLIYKDDFEEGIKNWQLVAVDRFLHSDEPLPYPRMENANTDDSVSVAKNKRAGKSSRALRIDGTKHLVGVMLNESLPECFAVEYDLYVESLPKEIKVPVFNSYFIDLANVKELRKIEFYEKPIISNCWEHRRTEYITVRTSSEELYVRIRQYIDGEFVSDTLAKCSDVKILPWANRCVVWIDNIRVFEVVPSMVESKVYSAESKSNDTDGNSFAFGKTQGEQL